MPISDRINGCISKNSETFDNGLYNILTEPCIREHEEKTQFSDGNNKNIIFKMYFKNYI